jgi:DNA-3-methyladenine glycosylase II
MPPPLPVECAAAVKRLTEIDPILADVIARVGPCEVVATVKVDLFQALLRSIIYQQLHGKAAAAIHGRVLKVTGGGRGRRGAAALQSVPDNALRAAGLSANKLLAIRDLAAKTLDGTVPTARVAAQLGDDELIERLTAVRGIGPWTVHMLMIFHLGRPDVMPTGDFGIRKAFSRLYRRGRVVKPEAILRQAKLWQPHRSVASWYLWRSLDPSLSVVRSK